MMLDPCEMEHLIPSYRRKSQTKANTYVTTYIVGKNSPKKIFSQHSLAIFHLLSSTKTNLNDTLVYGPSFIRERGIMYDKRPCMDTTELPVRFLMVFGFSNTKKCPNNLTLVSSGTGRILLLSMD